jgi:hypothetical protein
MPEDEQIKSKNVAILKQKAYTGCVYQYLKSFLMWH